MPLVIVGLSVKFNVSVVFLFRVSFKKGKLVVGTVRSFSGFPKFCSEFW